MEQAANNSPVNSQLTSDLQADRYRRLVFGLLESLKHASLQIREGSGRFNFGEAGSRITGELEVLDPGFYKDLVHNGSIGAAEAYIEGKWTSPDLTRLVQVMASNQKQLDALDDKTQWITRLKHMLLRRRNVNTEEGSRRNILAHYDIGNDLYSRFLDPAMQYSSAIYQSRDQSLSEAQQNKMRVICERLSISPGDRVLEIGTGWGGLSIYMATHYDCHVTTTTISDAQYEYTRERIKALGLQDRVTLLKRDYRKLEGRYDRLVSIEMIEAVGHEYLNTFFSTCSQLLTSKGKMLIQSITIADQRYDRYRKSTDFIQKYIFPGGCLPSVEVISKGIANKTDMVIHQIDDIGLHYARTLNDWRVAFEHHWHELKQLGYSEEFRRLWLFYLCYCEGAFLERVISTHHIVARKPGYRGHEDEEVLDY